MRAYVKHITTKIFASRVVTRIVASRSLYGMIKVREWMEKARLWASAPEDEEVEDGQYSAYHWAKKAETLAGSSRWELDGATKIKPIDNKLVGTEHLTGEVSGGLFHP